MMNSLCCELKRHSIFEVSIVHTIVAFLVIQIYGCSTPYVANKASESVSNETITVLHNSIAILPFENLSINPDDAYIAMGIHKDLLYLLGQLQDVSVISHNGIFELDDSAVMYANYPSDISITEIASKLNVGTVLKGRVRYSIDRVNIAVQLFDASGNNQLWSESYELDIADIFTVQARIVENIVMTLGAEVSEAERDRIGKPLTNSVEAYKLYLKANLIIAHLEAGMPHEFYEYLDQAIAIDPDFAQAHAIRATGTGLAHTFGNRLKMPSLDDVDKLTIDHAQKALALNPNLPFAHMAQALTHYSHGRKEEGKQAYERALALGPNLVEVLNGFSHFLSYYGDDDKAVRLAERAQELTPNIANWHARLGIPLLYADRPVEAAYRFREGLKYREFPWLHRLLAMAEYLSGDRDEAIKELRIAEQQQAAAGRAPDALTAYTYSLLGLKDDATRLVTEIETRVAQGQFITPVNWTFANLAASNYDKAYEILRPNVNSGVVQLQYLKGNFMKDPVLEEPRFAELRNQVGSLN